MSDFASRASKTDRVSSGTQSSGALKQPQFCLSNAPLGSLALKFKDVLPSPNRA